MTETQRPPLTDKEREGLDAILKDIQKHKRRIRMRKMAIGMLIGYGALITIAVQFDWKLAVLILMVFFGDSLCKTR